MTMQPYSEWQPQALAVPATDRRTGNVGEVISAWILAVLTLGYFLPWAIAATRGKSNSLAIALVDLFAGWTLIGWVVALVMACGAHQPVAGVALVTQQGSAAAPAGWYPDAAGVQRYWDGSSWTQHTGA